MAIGDEGRKSYQSDGSTYNLNIQTRQVSSNDAYAMANFFTEKKPAAKPAAHRSSLSSADTGTISSTGNADIGNSAHIACFVELASANDACSIALALFDASDTLIGITEIKNFQAHSSWIRTTNKYVSESYVFETKGASKVKALVNSISGTIDIYLIPL